MKFPTDPHQTEREYPQILQAIYGHVTAELDKAWGRYPSAAEVDKHMRERAEKYPVCMLVILLTCYLELTKLMGMSVRVGLHGNTEIFIATLRMALPLFVMTHKTEYVRLISDFLTWWECASPAMHVIYETFILTQIGPTGFPKFSDLFVENKNKKYRHECGKLVKVELDVDLEKSTFNQAERAGTSNIIQELQTGTDRDTQWCSATHINLDGDDHQVKVFDYLNDIQLFHAIDPPIVGKDKNGETIYAGVGSNVLPGRELMNLRILNFPDNVFVLGDLAYSDFSLPSGCMQRRQLTAEHLVAEC